MNFNTTKSFGLFSVLLLIVVLFFSSCSDDNQAITPLEYKNISHQALLDEINLARSSPKDYANLIEQTLQYYGEQNDKILSLPGKTPILTTEGKSAAVEAINYLKKQVGVKKLKLNSGLNKAAQYHCDLQGKTGQIGHDSPNGAKVIDRLLRFGSFVPSSSYGENIAYGTDTPRQIVMQLIIDDGVASRGHRHIIYNANFDTVGFGWGPHSVYRIMCVMDFAFGYVEK